MRDANKQNTLQTQTIHEVRAIKKLAPATVTITKTTTTNSK